jgi:Predicted ICC-like phosphoesterases
VKSYQIDEVIFSHEKFNVASHQVNVIGHHHPGICIKGRARQRFKLPCFYFENQTLIIPAYGEHTGLYLYQKTEENRIYPIFGNEIIEFNP